MQSRILKIALPVTVILLNFRKNANAFTSIDIHAYSQKIKLYSQNGDRGIRMSGQSEDFENDYSNFPSIKSCYTFSGGASPGLFHDSDDNRFPSTWSRFYQKNKQGVHFQYEDVLSFLSCVLLVTSSAVGGGIMVLPEIVSGPGIQTSLVIIMILYCINLLSGMVIGEVAIQQYEKSLNNPGCSEHTPPSSFKDLAEKISDTQGGIFVGGVSILYNWCLLAFNLIGAGNLLSSETTLFSNGTEASCVLCIILTLLLATQSDQKISKISSCAVTVLFTSFTALLFPGLLNIQHDPMTMPPTSQDENFISTIATVAPILITTMLYQNVVPTVTKLLNYDRFKVNSALVLGSGIPPLMYVAWCLAVIGGGIAATVGNETIPCNFLMDIFLMAAMGGSGIACSMSIMKEFRSLLTSNNVENKPSLPATPDVLPTKKSTLPSVLLAVVPPFLVGTDLSNGEFFTSALEYAGSYLSPILYGILPVFFAHQLRLHDAIPGGKFSLSILALSSIVLMGQHTMNDILTF